MRNWIILTSLISLMITGSCINRVNEVVYEDIQPNIFPDYCDVTIPSNIAPLNFIINDSDKSRVIIKGSNDSILIVSGREIRIPARRWNKMLKNNSDKDITVTIVSLKDKIWTKYRPFKITIKSDPVDQYIAYRLIAPGYEAYSEMGIFQRDITSFREKSFITNRLVRGTCLNCHSFSAGDPGKMLFHLRGDISATMLMVDGKIVKLNTRIKETISNCIYPFWHPSGDYIAFSLNNISQVFHSVRDKRIEVFDSRSDIVVYDIRNNKLITTGLISSEDSFETFPAFTPDGKTLVFCTAAKVEQPAEYDRVKYNLCRISFDPSSGTFGDKVDTLLSVKETGQSISFPRISPDGKQLVFTMSAYGNFSIWHRDADLFALDLSNNRFRNIETINSRESESYHSWSSNSRWMVFSSRRGDGLYTRPFFTYISSDGTFSKPFMMPLKDPDLYNESLFSYNVPEFVKGEIRHDQRSLLKSIASRPKDVIFEVKER